MDNLLFGNRIHELRMKKGLSSRALSALLGKSESYVNKIENNLFSPPLHIILEISAILEITPCQIFCSYKNCTISRNLDEATRLINDVRLVKRVEHEEK